MYICPSFGGLCKSVSSQFTYKVVLNCWSAWLALQYCFTCDAKRYYLLYYVSQKFFVQYLQLKNFVILHIVVNFELKFWIKCLNTSLSFIAWIYFALNRDQLRALLRKVTNIRVLEEGIVSLSVSGRSILRVTGLSLLKTMELPVFSWPNEHHTASEYSKEWEFINYKTFRKNHNMCFLHA